MVLEVLVRQSLNAQGQLAGPDSSALRPKPPANCDNYRRRAMIIPVVIKTQPTLRATGGVLRSLLGLPGGG